MKFGKILLPALGLVRSSVAIVVITVTLPFLILNHRQLLKTKTINTIGEAKVCTLEEKGVRSPITYETYSRTLKLREFLAGKMNGKLKGNLKLRKGWLDHKSGFVFEKEGLFFTRDEFFLVRSLSAIMTAEGESYHETEDEAKRFLDSRKLLTSLKRRGNFINKESIRDRFFDEANQFHIKTFKLSRVSGTSFLLGSAMKEIFVKVANCNNQYNLTVAEEDQVHRMLNLWVLMEAKRKVGKIVTNVDDLRDIASSTPKPPIPPEVLFTILYIYFIVLPFWKNMGEILGSKLPLIKPEVEKTREVDNNS